MRSPCKTERPKCGLCEKRTPSFGEELCGSCRDFVDANRGAYDGGSETWLDRLEAFLADKREKEETE